MLDLIDKKVTHKVFGEGKVLSQNDSVVEVVFLKEHKKFIYPDAFAQHLVIHNLEDSKLLQKMIRVKENELKEKELQLEANRQIQREKEKLRMEYEKMTNNHKLHGESQMVFWCDTEEKISALQDWSIFTGVTKSGINKGKPNKAVRLHRNSAVVLTERDEKAQEKDREILGIYMVEDTFIGKLCEDGKIVAHSKYKIQLSKEESEQLLFWKYYKNKKTPEKISWNTGKYRYFDNEWMAQILVDIVAIKKDPVEKEVAQQFLKYFCKVNQISPQELQNPNGVLAKVQ